jgi:hypothetical protein
MILFCIFIQVRQKWKLKDNNFIFKDLILAIRKSVAGDLKFLDH